MFAFALNDCLLPRMGLKRSSGARVSVPLLDPSRVACRLHIFRGARTQLRRRTLQLASSVLYSQHCYLSLRDCAARLLHAARRCVAATAACRGDGRPPYCAEHPPLVFKTDGHDSPDLQ